MAALSDHAGCLQLAIDAGADVDTKDRVRGAHAAETAVITVAAVVCTCRLMLTQTLCLPLTCAAAAAVWLQRMRRTVREYAASRPACAAVLAAAQQVSSCNRLTIFAVAAAAVAVSAHLGFHPYFSPFFCCPPVLWLTGAAAICDAGWDGLANFLGACLCACTATAAQRCVDLRARPDDDPEDVFANVPPLPVFRDALDLLPAGWL